MNDKVHILSVEDKGSTRVIGVYYNRDSALNAAFSLKTTDTSVVHIDEYVICDSLETLAERN